MARKRKKESKGNNAVLPVMRPDAAGIDIGATENLWRSRRMELPKMYVRFRPSPQDLYALADWLKQCGVKTVAMESTGVYWIPLFQILESRRFEVCLVNAPACEECARNLASWHFSYLSCAAANRLSSNSCLVVMR